MPLAHHQGVGRPVVEQADGPAQLAAATAAAWPMMPARCCLPPKPPPICSTRTSPGWP